MAGEAERARVYREPNADDPLFTVAVKALATGIEGGLIVSPGHVMRVMEQVGLLNIEGYTQLWLVLAASEDSSHKAKPMIACPQDNGDISTDTVGGIGLYFDPRCYPSTKLRPANVFVLESYRPEDTTTQLDRLVGAFSEEIGYRVHVARAIDEFPIKEQNAAITQAIDVDMLNQLASMYSILEDENLEETPKPITNDTSEDNLASPRPTSPTTIQKLRDPSELRTSQQRAIYDAYMLTNSPKEVARQLGFPVATVYSILYSLRKQGFLTSPDEVEHVKTLQTKKSTSIPTPSALVTLIRNNLSSTPRDILSLVNDPDITETRIKGILQRERKLARANGVPLDIRMGRRPVKTADNSGKSAPGITEVKLAQDKNGESKPTQPGTNGNYLVNGEPLEREVLQMAARRSSVPVRSSNETPRPAPARAEVADYSQVAQLSGFS